MRKKHKQQYTKFVIFILLLLIITGYIYATKNPALIYNIPSTSGKQPESTTNQLPSACINPEPLKHIYSPNRLVVLDQCKTVSGTVLKIIKETDGDIHIRLKVDPQYSDTINKANIDGNNTVIRIACAFDRVGLSPTATAGLPCGNLVVEIVCAFKTTDKFAVDACSGYENKIPVPKVNNHVVITGQFVSDTKHGGWNEIHPVYKMDVK